MKFLNNLERKIGKYAIRNLSLYIILCFLLGYILSSLLPNVYYSLVFSPYHIIEKHEYWRLVTWIVTNPGGLSIFTFIMLYYYFSIGTNLERVWGTFMYNLYIFGGIFLSVTGLMIVSLIDYFNGGSDYIFVGFSAGTVMTYYMALSIFLAFAAIYPDTTVLLYFLIPIKIKWLAYIDLAYLTFDFIKVNNIYSRVTIISCVLNFFIFYLINKKRILIRKSKTQRNFKRSFDKYNNTEAIKRKNNTGNEMVMPQGITKHKCAICGKTENDSDTLEFRFCSKCNGNYEYCSDHLFTHEHKK